MSEERAPRTRIRARQMTLMRGKWFYEPNSIAKRGHAHINIYFPPHLPRVWQLWLLGNSGVVKIGPARALAVPTLTEAR